MDKQYLKNEVMEAVRAADMVLVGLGEEFDCINRIRMEKGFEEGRKQLLQSDNSFLVPLWQRIYLEEKSISIRKPLENLLMLLEGKNYFVVSVSSNNEIAKMSWREERLVMPCGCDLYGQCSNGCEKHLTPLNDEIHVQMQRHLTGWKDELISGRTEQLPEVHYLCSACKGKISLNNIYNKQYDENGYLAAWQLYKKWLQGTVNRKLVVLELGVGMKFPTVIRFPFEKVAFFNEKAKFYRIHQNLYHLTEELSGKGAGIADNAIDWLENLC